MLLIGWSWYFSLGFPHVFFREPEQVGAFIELMVLVCVKNPDYAQASSIGL